MRTKQAAWALTALTLVLPCVLAGCRPLQDDEAEYVRLHACTAAKQHTEHGVAYTDYACESHPLLISLPNPGQDEAIRMAKLAKEPWPTTSHKR